MSVNKNKKIGKDVRSRLEFMEFRLYWEGQFTRRDLVDFFKISTVIGSADIKRYNMAAPDNIKYNYTLKAFIPTPEFIPQFYQPSVDSYLSQLWLSETGVVNKDRCLIKNTPSCDPLTIPYRKITLKVLKTIVFCVNNNCELLVKYQSLSQENISERWIAPHAFFYDGKRWHVRAYCYTRAKYRDFVIGRIVKIINTKKSNLEHINDTDWQTTETLEIAPHPGLSDNQKEIIEREFGMKNGKLQLAVRKAALFYLIEKYNLGPGHQKRCPAKQQIVIASS